MSRQASLEGLASTRAHMRALADREDCPSVIFIDVAPAQASRRAPAAGAGA
jgi:hypothetical protein